MNAIWWFHIMPYCNNNELFLMLDRVNHQMKTSLVEFVASKAFDAVHRFRLSLLQHQLLHHMISNGTIDVSRMREQAEKLMHISKAKSATTCCRPFDVYTILYRVLIRAQWRINSILCSSAFWRCAVSVEPRLPYVSGFPCFRDWLACPSPFIIQLPWAYSSWLIDRCTTHCYDHVIFNMYDHESCAFAETVLTDFIIDFEHIRAVNAPSADEHVQLDRIILLNGLPVAWLELEHGFGALSVHGF